MSFTKEHTLITKGILIIMMLMHHLFVYTLIEEYSVTLTMNDNLLFMYICIFFKVCISGFAFLSAFGMTHSLQKEQSLNSYIKIACKRIITLISAVLIIYFLAIFYKRFIIAESIRNLYDKGNGFHIIYMFIDMFGLATFFNTPTINITWWYLTYALLLIIAIPFIYLAYKKFRYLLLPATYLFALLFTEDSAMFSTLLPSVLFGVAFSYEGWFEKINNITPTLFHKLFRVFFEIVSIFFSYHLYRTVGLRYCYLFAFFIPLLVYELIYYIPLLNYILKFIGKHATNIFLTHTFIYYYFYTDFIYSFKKDWIIFFVLLILCLIISIFIELLKKYSGYNLLVNKILYYIDNKVWL